MELFAGVGGFRLGLEAAGWRVTWSNQWEPTTNRQHASECYVVRFGPDNHVCEDIAKVLDDVEKGKRELPDHDLLVGGFPCQDYSVARTLSQATGIQGKKGVLWWEIYRVLLLKRPRLIFLENVDRLLKSPAYQRGRDFAIMLACLSDLGYLVEWRVVNAADYGFPQKRRRVFILGQLNNTDRDSVEPLTWLLSDGILAKALPVTTDELQPPLGISDTIIADFRIEGDIAYISDNFGKGLKVTPFNNAGIIFARDVWTRHVMPRYDGPRKVLKDVLQDHREVDEAYFIPDDQLPTWQYLKGAKNEKRVHKPSGAPYYYTEGAIPFPDDIDQPSRTILTGEGGISPSRFKHIIQTIDGKYRRLTSIELERLNGFPDGWTDIGISDGKRAFLMGNALVVGVVERIGKVLAQVMDARVAERGHIKALE